MFYITTFDTTQFTQKHTKRNTRQQKPWVFSVASDLQDSPSFMFLLGEFSKSLTKSLEASDLDRDKINP